MHTTIRRYEDINPDKISEIVKRMKEGFVSIVSSSGGFKRYQFLNAGHGAIITISVFETELAARASNKMAANWVNENLFSLLKKPTQISVGEAMIDAAA